MAKRGRGRGAAAKARAARLAAAAEADSHVAEGGQPSQPFETGDTDVSIVHHKKFGERRVKPIDEPIPETLLPPTENIKVPVIVNGLAFQRSPTPTEKEPPHIHHEDVPVQGGQSVIIDATSYRREIPAPLPLDGLPTVSNSADFMSVLRGLERLQTGIRTSITSFADDEMVENFENSTPPIPPHQESPTPPMPPYQEPPTIIPIPKISEMIEQETCQLSEESPVDNEEGTASPSTLDTKSEESQSVDDEVLAPPEAVTIRRSTRIRSIGILKQKERTASSPDGEKPVKVKSRWRRSSEMEMHTTPPGVASAPLPPLPPPVPESQDELQERLAREERERAEGLKLFKNIVDNEYKIARNACKEAKRMTCDCILGKEEMEKGDMGCGDDCLNRMLFLECGDRCALGDRCSNKCFQKHAYSDCMIFKTEKKGFGLKANKPIESNTFIMEYVGEVLDQDGFARRVKSYAKDEVKHFYFMSLKGDTVIDATNRGNISRFINHSCDPNAETQKWTVNGELRIGFFSKRLIRASEEITFDYKFQRYGKEAQKCYCEAANCRGWIGENPDDDESDDSDAASEEDDTTEENSPNAETEAMKKEENSDMELDSDYEAKPEAEEPKPRKKRGRPRKAPGEPRASRGRPRRKEELVVEDLGLEEEIERLNITGVKNRAHTLMLSRLMVRAEDWSTRSRLLDLIAKGDEPCRRLFIDYHGLRFLHAWMHSTSVEGTGRWQRRLEILKTLATLPVPNKTMLIDSKVLALVEEWSGNKTEGTSAAVLSPSGDSAGSDESKPSQIKLEEGEIVFSNQNSPVTEDVPVPNDLTEDETFKNESHKVMIKLLESWALLKEVFKIPKKERIEQMKEHEREADRGYVMSSESNLENVYSRYKIEKSERRDTRERDRIRDRGHESPSSSDPSWFTQQHTRKMSKQERRQMFALKVLREEENAKKCMQHEELWSQHQARCAGLGLDPTVNAAIDPISGYPVFFNQKTRTWSQTPPNYQSYPGYSHPAQYQMPGYPSMVPPAPPPPHSNSLPYPMLSYSAYPTPSPSTPMYMPPYPTPSSVITLTPEPTVQQVVVPIQPPLPRDPNDPVVSAVPTNTPMKLPPKWKAAKDPRGVLYYYHIKKRRSQGEPPSWTEKEILNEAKRLAVMGEQDSSSESEDTESENEEVPESVTTEVPDTDFEDPVAETEAVVAGEVADTTTQPDEFEEDEDNETLEEVAKPRDEEPDEDVPEEKTETPKESPMEQPSQSDAVQSLPVSHIDSPLTDVPSTRPAPKPTKKREGLVQEHIISPRCESSRAEFKKYKEAKLKRKKRREEKRAASALKKKKKRDKHVTSSAAESSTDRKIKENFKTNIAGAIVSHLNPYRRPDCKIGRITNNDDFKHLARKLTHFVMLKELKHCQIVDDLQCNESVKAKSRDFVRKYMSKFGPNYERLAD